MDYQRKAGVTGPAQYDTDAARYIISEMRTAARGMHQDVPGITPSAAAKQAAGVLGAALRRGIKTAPKAGAALSFAGWQP
jgi:hypothetical protein